MGGTARPWRADSSGFALQPGQSLRPGEHVARIHDLAAGLQLAAEVDEFYFAAPQRPARRLQ